MASPPVTETRWHLCLALMAIRRIGNGHVCSRALRNKSRALEKASISLVDVSVSPNLC